MACDPFFSITRIRIEFRSALKKIRSALLLIRLGTIFILIVSSRLSLQTNLSPHGIITWHDTGSISKKSAADSSGWARSVTPLELGDAEWGRSDVGE